MRLFFPFATVLRAWGCLLAVGGMPLTGVCAAELQSFHALYTVRTAGLEVGQLERRLTLAPAGHYRFASDLRPTGLAALLRDAGEAEISEGEINANEVRPLDYTFLRHAGGKHKSQKVRFDRRDGKALFSDKAGSTALIFRGRVLDKLSYQLALMRDLSHATTALDYVVADDRQLRSYHLQRVGEETVAIQNRAVIAQKIVYARAGTQRQTTLWCAAEYGYLPVKIAYQDEHGKVTVATLIPSPTASP